MRKLRMPSGKTALCLAPALLAASLGAYGQSLEEITVTARKTEENLQEVPLAITALGAEEIDRLGVKDLNSLSQQDTSVQFDEGFTPSDTRITIRGLSPTRGRPNAATLIDGIDISSEAVSNAGGSLLIDPRLIDVQRIEIVKGPQSALYGRSAFAGAIQYVTKDPADVLSGGIFLDYNQEGDKEMRGDISIPLGETFGMRINGLVWEKEGYYTNAATGNKLGDGDGNGVTLTLKWEPTDNFDAKWRTDFSDDHFGVAAQTLLNDRNTIYDLGNEGGITGVDSMGRPRSGLAPYTSECVGGFLSNPLCNDGLSLDTYFTDNGLYRSNGEWDRNIWNKQVVQAYTGKFPDGDELQPAISPDYRWSNNPYDALNRDFAGTDRRVFRNSLVMNWQINDAFEFSSLSGWTDADENTATDLGKNFVDNCRPEDAANPQFSRQICDRGDGINDNEILFQQDSENNTKQISQEFRLVWDINEDLLFTQGLQYWREKVTSRQLNSSVITGGPLCYVDANGVDTSTTPSGQFAGLTPEQYACANEFVPAAYWTDEAFRARPTDILKRETDHYSWYGQLQWNVTENFKTTFEARYTREDNSVTGQAQVRCLENISEEFLNEPDVPGESLSPWRDVNTGRVLCEGYVFNAAAGGFVNPSGTEYGALTGPGSVIPCGQTGSCYNLGLANPIDYPGGFVATPVVTDNSWWPYGFSPQGGYEATVDRKDRYWAPKLTLEYFWNDDVMTYFSWSRGIKPGGFSLLTQGAFGLDANGDGVYDEIEFEPERLDVWEIGAKTTLFDNRLRLNGSLFFQDFKDKQVTVQEVVEGTTGTRVRNISGTEVKGLEMDATFQATDNLRLTVGYTYLSSEYTDYTFLTSSANDIARTALGPNGQACNPNLPGTDANGLFTTSGGEVLCFADLTGNEVERVPKHAVLVNANYTNALFDTGMEWYGEVNWRYQDSRWLEQWNITQFKAYSLTNVSAGIIADYWDIQFYITNLFDDDTILSGGGNPGIPTGSFGFGFTPGPQVNASPKLPSDVYANMPNPRLIGARVNFRFGE